MKRAAGESTGELTRLIRLRVPLKIYTEERSRTQKKESTLNSSDPSCLSSTFCKSGVSLSIFSLRSSRPRP